MAGHLRDDLVRGRADLASGVRQRLRQVTSGRKAVAQQLREILSREKAELAPAAARRRSEVLVWMGGLTADRLAAGQEWRQMVAALGERRAGVIAPEAPAPMTPKEEAVVEAGHVAAEVEEEEETTAGAGEVTQEAAALRDRVFAYLADHPDGVRLVEIERQFGLSRLESSRLVRNLKKEGKSRKQNLLYFAT